MSSDFCVFFSFSFSFPFFTSLYLSCGWQFSNRIHNRNETHWAKQFAYHDCDCRQNTKQIKLHIKCKMSLFPAEAIIVFGGFSLLKEWSNFNGKTGHFTHTQTHLSIQSTVFSFLFPFCFSVSRTIYLLVRELCDN